MTIEQLENELIELPMEDRLRIARWLLDTVIESRGIKQSPIASRSILDILADAPGHLVFETAEDVDAYISAERDAWQN